MRHRQRRQKRAAAAPDRHVCCRHTGEQRVRVTNWMQQVWVLLVANAVITALTWRIADRVGLCLWWATCDEAYFWSGVGPTWLRSSL